MALHEVMIDQDKCIGCGICARECAACNIEIFDKKAKVLSSDCIMCGHCSAVCPKQAISISGYHDKVIDVDDEIRLCPDDILRVIRFRRTIRQFQEKEISQEIIQEILEAGRLTHTAKNLQDVSFIVLDKERERFEKMAVQLFRKIKLFANLFSASVRKHRIDNHFFFFHAPIVIVILAEDKVNGILAAQNMEFVAEAHGLGVLFSGFFTIAAQMSFAIKKALKVPRGKKVAMTLILGYPNVKFLRSVPRKELDVRYM